MNTNMRTPGPGPQARCGKGVWSPEDQGDRCRVPRSFGPSGAGREQVKFLKRNQLDDHPTKETRRCGGYTSSDRLTAATFPSRGRQKGCAYPSSNPPTAGPSPPRGMLQSTHQDDSTKKEPSHSSDSPFFNHFSHFAFQRSSRCGQICRQPMGNSQHTSRASSTPTEVSIMRLMAYAT